MITSSIQDILMMYVWEDDLDLNSRDEIVAHAQKKLFDFPYPLYDSKMKEQFEEDFIRHFYTREIGSESISLFKLRLQDYLYLNMEKWERLYQSMDESLNPFNNIDVRTTRSTDESEQTDRDLEDKETGSTTKQIGEEEESGQLTTRSKDEQEDIGLIRGVTTGTEEDTENQQQTDITSHADDFTRNLEQTPPDERLSITANDGVGLIDYASQISENKNVNDSEQGTTSTGTTGRSTTGSEDETSDRNRILSGSDTEQKDSNRTATGTEEEERTRDKTELEKQLRAFEQALDEHEIGRRTNQSFVQLYGEYIQHFQGLHRLMFKDMEKLFLGVF